MATIDRSTERSIQPHYAQASRGARAAAAAAAVLISTSLLGGLLVLFEMQSLDGAAAQVARQSTPTAPPVAVAHSSNARS